MGIKKHTRQWTNGEKSFPSVYGVKNGFAWELILMGEIKVPADKHDEILKNPAKYLESKGWRWEKL